MATHANTRQETQSEILLAGQYAIDLQRPLNGAGGLPAFVAVDRRSLRPDLMAVQTLPGLPPRPFLLQTHASADSVLLPLAHGMAPGPDGQEAYFVVSQAPPGPSLHAFSRRWSESALIELVLRPAAAALEILQAQGTTHRAIRPDNVFQGSPSGPVTLGMAWAGPAACLQPAVCEPPYVAMCPPSARGEGRIADDVYALGVLIVSLALGRVPLVGLEPEEIIRRKLDQGSFAAIVGTERLPSLIADLVRGMLAEDPDHRPTPSLLGNPLSARARRIAARPPRRAQQALDIAGQPAWNARSVAHGMARHPDVGVHLLRTGQVDHWLRRSLGDGSLAATLDDVVRQRATDDSRQRATEPSAEDLTADAMLVIRAVATLDPHAPLCWRGLALWPDGIGPALAESGAVAAATTGHIAEIVSTEAVATWATLRPDRCDAPRLRMESRQMRSWLRQRGPGGGLPRVSYALNPLMPCGSPNLAGQCVTQMATLIPALESAAAHANRTEAPPLDAHIGAFIAARSDARLEAELTQIGAWSRPGAAALAQLRLFATLQVRLHRAPAPALAAWLADICAPAVALWQNRPRRARIAAELRRLADQGWLAPMLDLLDNPASLAADQQGAERAAAEARLIDAELAAIAAGASARAETAHRLGQEISVGAGLAVLALAIGVAAF